MHGAKQMYYMFASCRLQPGGEWLTEISTVYNYKCSTAIEQPTECLGMDVVKHLHIATPNVVYIHACTGHDIGITLLCPPKQSHLPEFHLPKSQSSLVLCTEVKEKQRLRVLCVCLVLSFSFSFHSGILIKWNDKSVRTPLRFLLLWTIQKWGSSRAVNLFLHENTRNLF